MTTPGYVTWVVTGKGRGRDGVAVLAAGDTRGRREGASSGSAEVSACGGKRWDLRMLLIRRASKEARNPIQSVSDLCPLERDDDSTLATDLMKKRASEDGVISLY